MEKERPALMVKGVCVARYRAAMADMGFAFTANDAPPQHSCPSGSQVNQGCDTTYVLERVLETPW